MPENDAAKQISVALGDKFERQVINLFCRDTQFCQKFCSLLKEEHFSSSVVATVYKTTKAFLQAYNRTPSCDELASYILATYDTLSADVLDVYIDFAKEVYEENLPDRGFVESNLVAFIKKAEVSRLIWHTAQSIKTLDINELKANVDRIAGIKSTDDDLGVSSDNFLSRLLLRDEDESNILPTGFVNIDRVIRGGFRPGELAVVLAPTNRGKSFVLTNIGRGMLSMGSSIAHYSLEMSEDDSMDRYVASMTRVNVNELTSSSKFRTIAGLLEGYKDFTKGKLYIKFYSAKEATLADIQNHLDMLGVQGVFPETIIIDYIDLLKPSRERREKRFELGELYEATRAFGKRNNACVITASQTNRQGELIDYDYKSKKTTVKPNALNVAHISEDWSKAGTADYIFGIRRPTKYSAWSDEERLVILDVLKSRTSSLRDPLLFRANFNQSWLEDITSMDISIAQLKMDIKNQQDLLDQDDDENTI